MKAVARRWLRFVPPTRLLSGGVVVRLTLTVSLLIVMTCVALSVVFVRRHLAEIRAGLVDRGRAISEFVAREAELGVLSGNVDALRQLGIVARAQRDVVYCAFVDGRGAVLLSLGDESGRVPATRPHVNPGEPIAVRAGIWEFRTPVRTTSRRPKREELGFTDQDRHSDDDAERYPQEQIGEIVIGLTLEPLEAEARRTSYTAALFTLLVTGLSVLSAILLTRGPLRTLASAAALAGERERMAELKARFVMQASHEFRTPLAVILAASDALRRYSLRMTEGQQQKRLEKIQASVRQMTELLDDVLTVGRADSGKLPCVPQRVDLSKLCREMVTDMETTLAQTHRIVVTVSDETQAMVDLKLVRQILRNLLSNAVKYSPQGGKIELGLRRRDDSIEIRVSDQGIGIAPADQVHVFESFFRGAKTDAFAGSGLGLSITKNAVELHGGTITVQSAVGMGTTFTVMLPIGRLAASPASEPPSASAGD